MHNENKINKTKIFPLRWFANMCGSIAGWAIMRISYNDELENYGWQYKLHSTIWKITWPVYYRFGTMYEWDFDMSGDGWDDYDSEGIPYWEKTGVVDPNYTQPWDFIDEETGDAFRIVKNKN